MKIIPKKIKVKNTVWKCYSLIELVIILILFIIVFLLFVNKNYIISTILFLISVIAFIPTNECIFYEIIFEFLKYFFSNKKNLLDKIKNIKNIYKDGVIQYKNGNYGKVIKLGQKNFFLEEADEQEVDIECLNKALKQLDLNASIEIVKIDRPINFDNYIEDLEYRILNEKKNLYDEAKDNIKIKILKERERYIDKLNSETKQYISSFYLVVYSKSINDVNNVLENIANEIKKSGISVDYLNNYETAVFLKYSYSRNFDEREIYELNENEIIDWIYPNNIISYSNKYIVDGLEASIMTINDFPLRVKNAWANDVFNIPNTKVVMHIKTMEKTKAIKKIDKAVLEMETKEIISTSASEINSSETHKISMKKLLNSLQSENESLLDVSFCITCYNYDKDINYRRNVRRQLNSNNFKTSMMFCAQKEGIISSSINSIHTLKKYERGINSKSLASFYPFVRNYVMDDKGIVLGCNKNSSFPFIFDIWKRGELYQNSNAMVIGKSGSGKTFFLKNLLINEWSNSTRIIICDPEAEYINLTRNLDGNIIDVGNAKEGILNPFHIYKILTEEGEVANSVITFNTHLKMLESFIKIVLPDVSNDVIELINLMIVETYKYKGITENTDCSNFDAIQFPVFSDLIYIMNKKLKKQTDEFSIYNYKVALLHLQKFVTGRYSDIWNSPSTLEVDANIINFNFQSLFSNKNNIVANAQMLLVFRFIEQEIINARELNKFKNNIRSMIIIDEAHLFIDPKYPIALDFFYQMSKRIRKYNGAFIPTTQNIADWNSNEELRYKTSTILKNSQYTFIFKLSSPDMQDVLDIYKAGDSFNKEERRMIISATTGQAFFVGSSELRTSVQIKANDYIKEMFDNEVI